MERTPNKSQSTKLTPEKKILPPLLPGFELATFRSRAQRSNQQAISAAVSYKAASSVTLRPQGFGLDEKGDVMCNNALSVKGFALPITKHLQPMRTLQLHVIFRTEIGQYFSQSEGYNYM